MIQISQPTTPRQDVSTIRSDLYTHNQYTYWDITKIPLHECATCVLFRNPNCRTEKIKLYSQEPTILFPMCKAMSWLRHSALALHHIGPGSIPLQPTWDYSGQSGNTIIFPPSTSIFSFLYHSINASYAFIHLPPKLHNQSK